MLAMSVQNQQLAGFFFTGNPSTFLFVEGSAAWLFDSSQLFSPLYEADIGFDCAQIYCQDTVMYIDPLTRET